MSKNIIFHKMEDNRTNISKSFLIRDLLRDLIEDNDKDSDEGKF